jgi:hypothetical protein
LIKVSITALTVLCTYILLITKYKNEVNDATFALVIVGGISFVISSFVVALYSTAMETIYVCFLVDSSEKSVIRQNQISFKALRKLVDSDP